MTAGNYLLALFWTEAIEVSVAVLMGYRRRLEVATVVLVNLVTHPLMCYGLLLNQRAGFVPQTAWTLPCVEAVVTLAEWGLMVFALNGRRNSRGLLALSVVMNGCSYLAGMVVYWMS